MGYNKRATTLAHRPEDLTQKQRETILSMWHDRTKSLSDIARACADFGKKPTDQAIKKTGFAVGLEPRGRAVYGCKASGNIKPNRFGIRS
jgi:hypothetical protein